MFLPLITFIWCAAGCGWAVSSDNIGLAVFMAFLALFNLAMMLKEV